MRSSCRRSSEERCSHDLEKTSELVLLQMLMTMCAVEETNADMKMLMPAMADDDAADDECSRSLSSLCSRAWGNALAG